jgi:Mrp family chromosome partitioning ATPase
MGRNFQLLKQLEIDADMTDDRPGAVTDRVIERESSPKDAGDPLGEEILRLAQTVFLANPGRAPRQVVFCGVDEEVGSSSVCASTGRAIAFVGAKSVCLVDANIRSPRLSRAFSVNTPIPFPGTTSIREQCALVDCNLWLAGTDLLVDDRGSFLPAADLKQLLKQLRDVFEYVLIDAPPTSVGGDAAVLGQMADATILVVEANSTRRLAARRAKETLESGGVRLLGTVLYNRLIPLPKRLLKGL